MEDINAPKKLPRDRKSNFTVEEANLIAERASSELELLKGSFSSSVTAKKKAELWVKITQEVNALGVCFRTEDEVRTKYRNMCRGAKEKFTAARKHAGRTGGGPPSTAQPTAAESLIVESMKDSASFSGIVGGGETIISGQKSSSTVVPSESQRCQETVWNNALDRHFSNLAAEQSNHVEYEVQPVIQIPSVVMCTQDRATVVEEPQNRSSAVSHPGPTTSGLQSAKKRPSMAQPQSSKKKKTAEDVYALQCKVLEREYIKVNLQIKLLRQLNQKVKLSNDTESLQLLSLIEQ